MNITTEELERCEVLLTLELDPAQEEDLLKKAAKRISRQVKIPGFRPGKAPYSTVVRRFGLEALQSEAIESSVEDLVKKALTDADITPYAQIQLEDVSWDPLTVKIKIPTAPKVELGDYREIRLEGKTAEVTDEDVQQALERLQDQHAAWTPVERPSELGDLISMSVVEKDGDEVLTQHESVEYELVARDEEESNQPDLTTPLLGLSAGESKTFSVTYPEDYQDQRYAGKEITISVDVSSIKAKELDPLDDDFARQVSDFETLDELKAQIRDNIRQQRQRQFDQELGNQALELVIDEAKQLEWPQALEDESVQDEIESMEQRLKNSGLTLDNFLQMQRKTREEFEQEVRDEVVERLQRNLVLARVAELEQLDVSNTEILQQAKNIADMYQGGEQLWRSILTSERQQRFLASDLLANKALHRLAAIARGEAPEPGQAEEAEPEVEAATPAAEAETTPAGAESEAEEPVEAGAGDVPPAATAAESDDEAEEESVSEKA